MSDMYCSMDGGSLLIGLGVGLVAGIFSVIGTRKIIRGKCDECWQGVATFHSFPAIVCVITMAAVVPLISVAESHYETYGLTGPASTFFTAQLERVSVSRTAITISYTEPVLITNGADLRLAIHNLSYDTYAELEVSAADGEHQSLAFSMDGGTSSGSAIRVLGYLYGDARIVDVASGHPAISNFNPQQCRVP